ncbi:hypothetical protein JCM8097_008686, partial [Rhodosporidiobolus ruineniae]
MRDKFKEVRKQPKLDPQQGIQFRNALVEKLGGEGPIASDALKILRHLFDLAHDDYLAQLHLGSASGDAVRLFQHNSPDVVFLHVLSTFSTVGQVEHELRRHRWREYDYAGPIPHPSGIPPPHHLVLHEARLKLDSAKTVSLASKEAKLLTFCRWEYGKPLSTELFELCYGGKGCGLGGGGQRKTQHERFALRKAPVGSGLVQGTANIAFHGIATLPADSPAVAAQGRGFEHKYNAQLYAATTMSRSAAPGIVTVREGMTIESLKSFSGPKALAACEARGDEFLIPGLEAQNGAGYVQKVFESLFITGLEVALFRIISNAYNVYFDPYKVKGVAEEAGRISFGLKASTHAGLSPLKSHQVWGPPELVKREEGEGEGTWYIQWSGREGVIDIAEDGELRTPNERVGDIIDKLEAHLRLSKQVSGGEWARHQVKGGADGDGGKAMATDLPCKILNAICFNLIIYFMPNLHRPPGNFFFFLLVSLTLTLTMSMFFRSIAALSHSRSQALVP